MESIPDAVCLTGVAKSFGSTAALADLCLSARPGTLPILWPLYVPLAKPVCLAYGLTSVSCHWNNFLWPLVITNRVESRPLAVGLSVFASTDQGIDWAIISAAKLMSSAPLLLGFLLFPRQFVQSFMRAGIIPIGPMIDL